MMNRRSSWRKASYSNGQASCVEVGHDATRIAVRDTKDPHGPALAFTATAWQAFTRRVQKGTAAR